MCPRVLAAVLCYICAITLHILDWPCAQRITLLSLFPLFDAAISKHPLPHYALIICLSVAHSLSVCVCVTVNDL